MKNESKGTILLVALFVVPLVVCAGCSGDTKNSGGAAPTIVAEGLSYYGTKFNVVVGKSYRITEATTDEESAKDLFDGRKDLAEGTQSAKGLIQQVYDGSNYRHYGNDGQDPMPLCKVTDQDSVRVDTDENEADGVQCTLNDGTMVYATSLWPKDAH